MATPQNNQPANQPLEAGDPSPHFFVTTGGRKVYLRPVSQIMVQQLNMTKVAFHHEHWPEVKIPTYTVEAAFGDAEVFMMDEEFVKNAANEEQKAQWAAHKEAVARMDNDIAGATTKYMLLAGIVPPSNEVLNEWKEQMEYFGFPLPTVPQDLMLAYIMDGVLTTFDDQVNCISAIMRISSAGMDPEVLQAAEEAFRRSVATQSRARAGKALAILNNTTREMAT